MSSISGDRQALHERIRQHAQAAGEQVKQHGRPNDLIERLQSDPAFADINWTRILDPTRYTGLAADQTRQFVKHTRQVLEKLNIPEPPAGRVEV